MKRVREVLSWILFTPYKFTESYLVERSRWKYDKLDEIFLYYLPNVVLSGTRSIFAVAPLSILYPSLNFLISYSLFLLEESFQSVAAYLSWKRKIK